MVETPGVDEIRPPVLAPSGGQVAAGWMLRIFGLLVFLGGGAYLTMLLFSVVSFGKMDRSVLLVVLGMVAGSLLVMAMGSLMACLGALLCGRLRYGRSGRRVAAVAAVVGRDVCLFLGASGLLHALGAYYMAESGGRAAVIVVVAVVLFAVGIVLSSRLVRTG